MKTFTTIGLAALSIAVAAPRPRRGPGRRFTVCPENGRVYGHRLPAGVG